MAAPPGQAAAGGGAKRAKLGCGLHLHPSGRPHTGWRRGRCWGWRRRPSCPPWPRRCSCCWPSPCCRGVPGAFLNTWARRGRQGGGGRGEKRQGAAGLRCDGLCSAPCKQTSRVPYFSKETERNLTGQIPLKPLEMDLNHP